MGAELYIIGVIVAIILGILAIFSWFFESLYKMIRNRKQERLERMQNHIRETYVDANMADPTRSDVYIIPHISPFEIDDLPPSYDEVMRYLQSKRELNSIEQQQQATTTV